MNRISCQLLHPTQKGHIRMKSLRDIVFAFHSFSMQRAFDGRRRTLAVSIEYIKSIYSCLTQTARSLSTPFRTFEARSRWIKYQIENLWPEIYDRAVQLFMRP